MLDSIKNSKKTILLLTLVELFMIEMLDQVFT